MKKRAWIADALIGLALTGFVAGSYLLRGAFLESLELKAYDARPQLRTDLDPSSEVVIVAIDETPFGTFVEIEGSDRGIAQMAEALGRGPDDYVLDSYRGLFSEHCRQRGLPVTDMVFEDNVKR